MPNKVIDLSKYNIVKNFSTIESTLNGAIIRCGFRGRSSGQIAEDPIFEPYIKKLYNDGFPVGVYFFTTAITPSEAVEEADFVVNKLQMLNILPSFPIFIDTEYADKNNPHQGRSDNLDISTRTNCILAFCNEIKRNGYYAGIYGSDSWFVYKLDMTKLSAYKNNLWVSHPVTKPKRVATYIGWQFDATNKIAGVDGNTDMSYWYTDINKNKGKIPVVINTPNTNKTASSVSITAGQKIILKNAPLYRASAAPKALINKSGIYYAWDNRIINNRIRITTNASYIKNISKITGWIDISSIH